MPFKVQVGPPQIVIHQGQTVLVTEHDGRIDWPSDKGLYFRDTRLISAWTIYANGESWELLNGGAPTHDTARIHLTNRALLTEDGAIPPHSLGLVLSRIIDQGMHEDIDLANYGMKPVRFNLELAIRADFADIFEVRTNRIVRRGRITTDWSEGSQRLIYTYRNGDFVRSVTIGPRRDDPSAVYANGRLSFEVRLDPGQTWHCCLLYDVEDGITTFHAPRPCSQDADAPPPVNHVWLRQAMQLSTPNEEFYRFYRQALEDMEALRLPMQVGGHTVLLPSAGLPWFAAPFGRDSLIVSLQTMSVDPDFARGALDVLGVLQSKERDDRRDAEPGKILHEIRYGELAHFKLIPHTPYYGTADATPLYLVVLHAAWRATGDRALLERHLATAEACLTWIDTCGDRDGDGFQEYQTRSPNGYENMGWKDSADSVLYPDGSLVKGPKALCELQGYVYDAWRRMAEIFDALDKPDRASALRAKAADLYRRFNEAFWDEEFGFLAYALDGDKRKVLTVASNAGQCLFSGIVAPQYAERVVRRLLAPDMNTGWGIRTLSTLHPAYNPYSYQNGSVWPHDNSLIALGFKRYGFDREAAEVARGISDAASHFLSNQLPELYAGIQRNGGSFPVQYLGANVPQAWAAGSAFALLQALLGLQPDAPNGMLYVDPHLPDWLAELTLTGFRLGAGVLDIRFFRTDEETLFEVLRGDAASVARAPFGSRPV
jgi:glycogen debranching enzyme